jgi:RNA polymerase sigma factor (sigma-70 family)
LLIIFVSTQRSVTFLRSKFCRVTLQFIYLMNISRKYTEKLVKQCSNNDRKAQEELYKLFYADMLRVCNSYLPDTSLAKEAFNTGFLKVFQSINSFDIQKGALGGWIRKIMVYTAIDLCRKELKFITAVDYPPDSDQYFIPPDVLDKLYFQDILTHIRMLPKATQMVFNLSVLDGFSHKEISEQLNISEGTSRWHLAEAKRKLRDLIGSTDKKPDLPEERSVNTR